MSVAARSYSNTVDKLMTCPAQKVHIADAVNELVLKKEKTAFTFFIIRALRHENGGA